MPASLSSPAARRRRNPFLGAVDLVDPPPNPYADDPVGYVSDELGFFAWSKQQDILRSVAHCPRTSVRACHGPGKTATAAQAALWFLDTRENSRVVTTAPIWAQVEQLLWREIRGAVARAHLAGRGRRFPVPNATKLEIGDQWFAIGLSTNEPERFQGHHADHLLLIVDEASGVDERIYEAAEGFMTAEGAKVLLLGNPTKVGGTFHRSFTEDRSAWSQIAISVFDTPNYTGERVPANVARALPRANWAEERAAAWGEDSPLYQVRVLGNFPDKAEDTVVSLVDVEAAQHREVTLPYPATVDQVRVVCDVARYGDDETVIGTRHGKRLRIREIYNGKSTTHTTGAIIRVWRELRQEAGADPVVIVDDDGVGGGVTDQLREAGYRVHPFHGGERAIEPDNYPNARSEAWFRMADALRDLDLDPDEQLLADLTSPRYKMNSKGQRVVEPKDETKKRLGRSPDRGDMVIMALVPTREVVLPEPGSHQRRPAMPPGGDWEATGPSGGSLTGDLLDDHM